jgi:putative redox protein
MVEITARYEGNLRCTVTHGPSGATIRTDAPKDNHGEGSAFSPTDLVAAALPSCMMTIMGIVAKRHGLDLSGMTAVTTKEMASAPARRLGRVATRIRVPLSASHPQREMLENAAHTCPVHKSLLAEIEAPIEFEWTG